MDRLYAPWRMAYIKADKEEGCVLCRAAQATDDRAALVLERGRHAFVVLNKYPYTNGHVMVSPYAHIGAMGDLAPEVWTEMMTLTQLCVRALDAVSGPHGYNIGLNVGRVAGAGVEDHLHLHVVPRWNGDVNFMPVLADCRVINQHIEESYEVLAAALAQLKQPTT